MNVLSISLLSTLLPIALISITIILYIVAKAFFLKKYSSYLEELEQFLTYEPYIETLTALRTVDITLKAQEKTIIEEMTASSNDKIKINDVKIEEINETKEYFAKQSNDIDNRIKELRNLKDTLLNNLEQSRVFSCKKIISKIENNKSEMNEIRKNINEQTKQFINPIIDFNNKRYKLEKIVSKIENTTKKWFNDVQNDIFQKNVEDRIFKMKEDLEIADNFVSRGNQEKAFTHFTLFKKTLFDLITFDNYFDKFKDILFVKSNQMYSKILNHLKKVKVNLGSNLERLNTNVFLQNFEDELADAKSSFYDLNISKTSENIEKYFNTLLGLTYAINQELNAYHFFSQFGISEIQKFFLIASEKYNEIKASCEKILGIDKLFYWNLQNEMNDIDLLMSEIDSNISEYTKSVEISNNLYSTKQSKYKKILQLLLTFFNECENIEKSIDIFYTEGVSQGLKYNQLKKIYIQGLADIKKFNIKLSIEDNENISLIEKKKQEIENFIVNQDNYSEKELKIFVDQIFSLIVIFIMKTVKKVLLVRSFTLINLSHSYKRIENNLYDKKVIECEDLIYEGKYEEGIKSLIDSIRGVNN